MTAALAAMLLLAAAAPPRGAAELCAAAKEALQEGRAAQAVDGFARCLAAAEAEGDPPLVWQALLGQGLAYEALGRPAAALGRFAEFLAAAPPDAIAGDPVWQQRRQVIEADVARLEPAVLARAARLTVTSRPADARLWVTRPGTADAAVATTPEVLYLEPGAWRIRVERSGRLPHEALIELEAGERRDLEVALLPEPPPQPPPEPPPGPAPAPPGPNDLVARPAAPAPERASPWAWVAMGGGAALLAAGGVFTALTAADVAELERLSRREPTADVLARNAALRARAPDRQHASWALYGVGGAALAAGLALWWWGEGEAPAVQVGPGARGAEARAVLRF